MEGSAIWRRVCLLLAVVWVTSHVCCGECTRLIVQMSKYAPADQHAWTVRTALFGFRVELVDVHCGGSSGRASPKKGEIEQTDDWIRPVGHQSHRVGVNASDHVRFPTDFVVLRIVDKDEIAPIRELLDELAEVKRVSEDRSVRHLLAPVSVADAQFEQSNLNALFNLSGVRQGGAQGSGVKVAVFDTGLASNANFFAHEVKMTDWTTDRRPYDRVGHGTFIAGVIAGVHSRCPGVAPDAEVITFRVFTGTQISYTSWFLDAFNYALFASVDVLNLSIGGPDHSDEPFVDKVNEVSAAGIIIVSAIGNDGPLYGSLNNPGDMMEVVGIGGTERNGQIASFSSRGMTTHELSLPVPSYGRVKPDIVTVARDLVGPSLRGGSCVSLSGRRIVANPASVKRALMESAKRLPDSNMFEQGAGLLDIPAAIEAMGNIDREYQEQEQMGLQLFPFFLDLTPDGCPYMWPFCAQALYTSAQPIVVNVTVLNPNSCSSVMTNIDWIPGKDGEYLDVKFIAPEKFWPWAGGLGIQLSVQPSAENVTCISEGWVRITVRSLPGRTETTATLPLRIKLIPTPDRKRQVAWDSKWEVGQRRRWIQLERRTGVGCKLKLLETLNGGQEGASRWRLLWDLAHNLRYPPAFIPRDNLDSKDPLDWLGDHPHTNFHELFTYFVEHDYFIELWDKPLDCLDAETASRYGVFLTIDPEDEFTASEVQAFERLVRDTGVFGVVVAEWYSVSGIAEIGFSDQNTRSFWSAVGGGAHVPSMNALLKPFGIAFGDKVYDGFFSFSSFRYPYKSGTALVRFPENGLVLVARALKARGENEEEDLPIFGLTRVDRTEGGGGGGGLVVFGDSTCLDTDTAGPRCHDLLLRAIRHLSEGVMGTLYKNLIPSNRSHLSGEMASAMPSTVASLLAPHSAASRKLRDCAPRRTLIGTDGEHRLPPREDPVTIPTVASAVLPPQDRMQGGGTSNMGMMRSPPSFDPRQLQGGTFSWVVTTVFILVCLLLSMFIVTRIISRVRRQATSISSAGMGGASKTSQHAGGVRRMIRGRQRNR